jgi:heterodisulfide reductase subunit C
MDFVWVECGVGGSQLMGPCSAGKHEMFVSQKFVSRVRFEVFTAVTMKNGVFWDFTPCGSCKNGRFRGT